MTTANNPQPLNNLYGQDISSSFDPAWQAAGISRILALACVLAESMLDPMSERWGTRTREAQAHIQALQEIANDVWPDISFGYGQQIVAYHYLGDQTRNINNILAVRQGVFNDPAAALQDMCERLATCIAQTKDKDLSPVNGDVELAALIVYNSGSFPSPDSSYWSTYSNNVANYRAQLTRIRAAR